MLEKRRPGRPAGTGIDDTPILRQIADIMVREPSVSATAAMRRIFRMVRRREMEPTFVRRMQVKWKAGKEMLLSEAQVRMQPKPVPSLDRVMAVNSYLVQALQNPENIRKVNEMYALGERLNKFASSAEFQRLTEGAALAAKRFEELTQRPGFKKMMEDMAVMDERLKRAASSPEFRKMTEGIARFQRDLENAGPIRTWPGF